MLVAVASTVTSSFGSGGGGGEGKSSFVKPEFGLIFWTVITFVILAFLLSRVAWKPLLGAVQERERSIEESLDRARKDREEAEKLLGEHKALIAEAHRERGQALDAARQEGEKLKNEVLEQARAQREQLLKQTESQVQAGLQQARTELRSLAADLAIQAAEKLLVKNLDGDTQRKLVEDYLESLERKGGDSSGLVS